MARVLAIAADLMLASRIEATLAAAGHEVTAAASLQGAPLQGAELVVADLEAESPAALVALGVPVLGCYSHVDVEVKRAAEAAGVDLAVPRSRLVREMPELAARLLAD